MYTEKEFRTQLRMLYYYYQDPSEQLIKRSGLSHPTVRKFLRRQRLRPYNLDILIGEVIKMNEEALARRRSLLERGKQVVRLESELIKKEHMKKERCIE